MRAPTLPDERDDVGTEDIVSETPNEVNSTECNSETPSGYQEGVSARKQRRPSSTLEYVVTDELHEALVKEMDRRDRGADRTIAEDLAQFFDGYVPDRTLIQQLRDRKVKKTSAGLALARLLGCPHPPIYGDPLGEDGAVMRELQELDSEVYARIMDEAKKARTAHATLAKIRARKPTED